MTSHSITTPEEISRRAHAIWEQCGRPDGQETEHWLRAERELENEHRQARALAKSSTPKSSAPKGSREVTRAESAIR